MFETTSEARCLHSCSALEAAFSVRYSFQASVANAIETMQLQERGVQNCIRTEYLVFVTGFKKSKENSRTPNAPICWFAAWYQYIPYVCICMNPKEKAHPFFYVLTMPKSTSLVSRSPQRNLGRAAFRGRWPLGAMAKAKLGKLGKLDAAHLKEDRNWQWHSSFPVPHLMVDIGVIIRCLGYFRFVNAMKGLLMKCLWELFVYLGMHLKPKFGDVQWFFVVI